MSRKHSIPIRSMVLARQGAASAAMAPMKPTYPWPNTHRSTAIDHYRRNLQRDKENAMKALPPILQEIARSINLKLGQKDLLLLAADQVEALADPVQSFAMLDDFEARLGLDVAHERFYLTSYHTALESPKRPPRGTSRSSVRD